MGVGGRFWCKTFNFDFLGYVNQLSTKKSVSYFLRELFKMYKKVFKESQTSQAFLSGTHGWLVQLSKWSKYSGLFILRC